jgi:hypothetical protein
MYLLGNKGLVQALLSLGHIANTGFKELSAAFKHSLGDLKSKQNKIYDLPNFPFQH